MATRKKASGPQNAATATLAAAIDERKRRIHDLTSQIAALEAEIRELEHDRDLLPIAIDVLAAFGADMGKLADADASTIRRALDPIRAQLQPRPTTPRRARQGPPADRSRGGDETPAYLAAIVKHAGSDRFTADEFVAWCELEGLSSAWAGNKLGQYARKDRRYLDKRGTGKTATYAVNARTRELAQAA